MMSMPFQSSGDPWEPNVVLNWNDVGLEDFLPYAMGYRQAAEILWQANERLRMGSFADFEIPPLIYLFRHSVELGIKNALLKSRAIARLNGQKPQYDNWVLQTHDLAGLWVELTNALSAIAAEDFLPSVAAMTSHTAVLDEFDRIDKGSYSFRYPTRKDGSLSLPQHFQFSLQNTVPAVNSLAAHLEALGHEIAEWMDDVVQDYISMNGMPSFDVYPQLKP
jgi:hypothetical protein